MKYISSGLIFTMSLTSACKTPGVAANLSSMVNTSENAYLSTKTTYKPQQDLASYATPPGGFELVFSQIVSRHSSRALTSPKADVIMYHILTQAKGEQQLTELGEKLLEDVKLMISAHVEMGYGNLSKLGIEEHKQLGGRFGKRNKKLLEPLAKNSANREIVVITSGVDRAVDSSQHFITGMRDEVGNMNGIKELGPNRFVLYFHKLKEETDKANIKTPQDQKVYDESLKYQAFLKNTMKPKIKQLENDPGYETVARAALAGLFKEPFLEKLQSTEFSNKKTTIEVNGKKFEVSPKDGVEETSKGLNSTLSILYDLYSIAHGMRINLNDKVFDQYLSDEHASYLSRLQDAIEFYEKGPSDASSNGVTYKMAQELLDDFFDEVERIAANDLGRVAKLRFAHAETIMPFAGILAVEGSDQAVPNGAVYSHENNPWRGSKISPLAANVQWDIYQNKKDGKVLVKMLYNEKEAAFKKACDAAKVAGLFYDFSKLKECYAYQNTGVTEPVIPASKK